MFAYTHPAYIPVETNVVLVGDVLTSPDLAHQITKRWTVVSDAGQGTALRLPVAPGQEFFVVNKDEGTEVYVMPPAGGDLGEGVDQPFEIDIGLAAAFVCVSATEYVAVLIRA